ncbi:hypothetical protein GCM10009122_13090 [Fulvivirga kasyanovii]|uniref:Cadherin domain-containing protein n=1 Tax=Fulvivirga kasyanovii TaxID=396812 RepID=A0ABW9RLZ1_9BACT|nr:hypothetical protein [Fulvivirga kasyanovii]MTI24966.1 hypothetical protein [Fulvivirga kasyanovii]
MKFSKLFRPLRLAIFYVSILVISSCGSDDNDGSPDEVAINITAKDATFTISEGAKSGQSIGVVEATATKGQEEVPVTFAISQQSVDNAFSINETSGELTVANSVAFDSDVNPKLSGAIVVSADGESLEVNLTITVLESMALMVADLTATIDENPVQGDTIATPTLVKSEEDVVTFEIISQSVEGAIAIDPSTGVITVADGSLFNFEERQSIDAVLQASGLENTATFRLDCRISNLPDEWVKYGAALLGEAAGDGFGRSLSTSYDENILVVGAPYNDQNGTDAGHVRVFSNNLETGWSKIGGDIDGRGEEDNFGFAVDVNYNGSTILIGSPNEETRFVSGYTFTAGKASIYRRNNNEWNFFDSYDPSGQSVGTNFGFSVAINGTGDDFIAGSPSDSQVIPLWIFRENDGIQWKAPNEEVPTQGSGGYSVDIDDSGVRFAEGSITFSSIGRVRVFTFGNSGSDNPPTLPYTQTGQDLMGINTNDRYGSDISLSDNGRMIAIGADQVDGTGTKPGYVQVFRLDGSTWIQVGQDLVGEAAGDAFGSALHLSEDGKTLVVGAYGNDGNGENAGHVRVFNLVENLWIQKGSDIDGEAAGDRFGISVTTGYLGFTIIAGADRNDDGGTDAGKVYSFRFESE